MSEWADYLEVGLLISVLSDPPSRLDGRVRFKLLQLGILKHQFFVERSSWVEDARSPLFGREAERTSRASAALEHAIDARERGASADHLCLRTSPRRSAQRYLGGDCRAGLVNRQLEEGRDQRPFRVLDRSLVPDGGEGSFAHEDWGGGQSASSDPPAARADVPRSPRFTPVRARRSVRAPCTLRSAASDRRPPTSAAVP